MDARCPADVLGAEETCAGVRGLQSAPVGLEVREQLRAAPAVAECCPQPPKAAPCAVASAASAAVRSSAVAAKRSARAPSQIARPAARIGR